MSRIDGVRLEIAPEVLPLSGLISSCLAFQLYEERLSYRMNHGKRLHSALHTPYIRRSCVAAIPHTDLIRFVELCMSIDAGRLQGRGDRASLIRQFNASTTIGSGHRLVWLTCRFKLDKMHSTVGMMSYFDGTQC